MTHYVHKVTDHEHHRNGISGAPFWVIRFVAKDENRNMVGVLFEEKGFCAVFDIDLLAKGNIKFGQNSWRGDNFEPELRAYIKKKEGD